MPHEISFFGTFMPAVIPLFLIGAACTWLLDRMLALTGLYRIVWHPALFRASVLVCVCCLLALTVYR